MAEKEFEISFKGRSNGLAIGIKNHINLMNVVFVSLPDILIILVTFMFK